MSSTAALGRISDSQNELAEAQETIKNLQAEVTGLRGFASKNANLYLALPATARPGTFWQRFLSALSPYNLFFLKPFGDPIDPMARGSLRFASFLIASIFLLETAGWTLLFNEILNRGSVRATWWTLPALVVGLMLGYGITAMEQAILTADIRPDQEGRRTRFWRMTWIRLILIIASAAIVSQSYELLFFNSEVEDRIHQETIRSELVAIDPEFEEMQKAAAAGLAATSVQNCDVNAKPPAQQPGQTPEEFGSILKKWYRDQAMLCQSAGSAVTGRVAALKANFDSYRRQQQQLQEQLNAANRTCSVNQDTTCDAAVSVRTQLRDLNAAISSNLRAQANNEAQKAQFEGRQGYYEQQGIVKISNDPHSCNDSEEPSPEQSRTRLRQLQRYITSVVKSQPQSTRPDRGASQRMVLQEFRCTPERPFADFEYGVTNKIRTLYSELFGLPYQWPRTDPGLIQRLTRDYHLSDPAPGLRWYRVFPWICVLVASLFLPMISLAYKFTLNKNLNLYYLTEYQQHLGHVGAMVSAAAEASFSRTQSSNASPTTPVAQDEEEPHGRSEFAGSRQPPDRDFAARDVKVVSKRDNSEASRNGDYGEHENV